MLGKIVPVLLLTLFLQTGQTAAQVEDFNRVEETPSYTSKLSAEEFFATGILRKETPMSDTHLAYSVILPEGWVKIKDWEEIIKQAFKIRESQLTTKPIIS